MLMFVLNTALFAAVEFGQVEKARAILDNNEVDINSYNSDGLSLLDVALLTSNVDMVKLLAKHGATEGLQCEYPFIKSFHFFLLNRM